MLSRKPHTSYPVISQILLHGCIEGGDSILTSIEQETSRDENLAVELGSNLYNRKERVKA